MPCGTFRTCIHNRCTPSGRSFSRHTASISLAIRQDCCRKAPCLTRKILAHTASPGYEYRFLHLLAWTKEVQTEEERAEAVTHFRCSLYDDFDISLEDIFKGLLP